MPLTTRQEGDLARQAFGFAPVITEDLLPPANRPPIHHFAGAGDGTSQDPHAVCQQAAVAGVVNVRFHYRTVRAQFLSLRDALVIRLPDHQVVQGVQSLGRNQRFTRLDGAVIRHFVTVDAAEAAPLQTAFRFLLHLAITPAMQASQNRQTQRHLHRRRSPTAWKDYRDENW